MKNFVQNLLFTLKLKAGSRTVFILLKTVPYVWLKIFTRITLGDICSHYLEP